VQVEPKVLIIENLKYAVHAYSWTSQWSNKTLGLIDHAKKLGFDVIEIPLMEIDLVDPEKIKERAEQAKIGLCTSTVISKKTDITAEDQATRKSGIEYLKACVKASAEMGAVSFSGVIYSAIGRKIDGIPNENYWKRSAEALKEVARFAKRHGLIIGIEPVNRYETFLINTCDQALKLIKMINEANVRIHLDAYHMNIEENNFYDPTKKAAPLLCHYHLSESHRGTPGAGTVNWDEIFRALAETNYRGMVGLESFIEVSDAMREATCVWRHVAPSSDILLTEGLKYLKSLEKKYYSS